MKDNILKSSIKEIKLASPSNDFTKQLMHEIHKIPVVNKETSKGILGVNFWIFVSLFVGLMVLLVFLSPLGFEANGGISNLLSSLKINSAESSYMSMLDQLELMPLSLLGILLGISFLLFLERFLSGKKQLAF